MDTAARTPKFRTFTALVATAIGCALLTATPATAAPAGSAAPTQQVTQFTPKQKVKVKAKVDKKTVKANGKVKVDGRFDLAKGDLATDALTGGVTKVHLQQQLSTGLWVDLRSAPCRPSGTFSFNLKIATTVTVRVYHPETTIYTSASSELFTIIAL
ncbi:hypothetical protein [Amycolatopsis cihanbeyliensis]|nr:hypothetical protein [Amycolatopsis cihanbeyliensis]